MKYLSIPYKGGTVYLVKEPLLYLRRYDVDNGTFGIEIVFRSGELLDLSFIDQAEEMKAVSLILSFLTEE